jgi:hypothetical protein
MQPHEEAGSDPPPLFLSFPYSPDCLTTNQATRAIIFVLAPCSSCHPTTQTITQATRAITLPHCHIPATSVSLFPTVGACEHAAPAVNFYHCHFILCKLTWSCILFHTSSCALSCCPAISSCIIHIHTYSLSLSFFSLPLHLQHPLWECRPVLDDQPLNSHQCRPSVYATYLL